MVGAIKVGMVDVCDKGLGAESRAARPVVLLLIPYHGQEFVVRRFDTSGSRREAELRWGPHLFGVVRLRYPLPV